MKNNQYEQLLEKQTSTKYQVKAILRGGDGIIYTRVSSLEQAQNNGSLEVQLKYCKDFAAANKILVREIFGGTYESAKTDGRKEFKRMIDYARKHKNISYIIVINFDRFSRTGIGASHLSEQLSKEGIIIKSVTQDIDTTTAIGRLQENFFHLLNNYDNRLKSDRTIINTREVMLKGYWPYATPMGYQNIHPKQRACFHEYVITDEGKMIRKGFRMLAERKYLFQDVINLLRLHGVGITDKSFRHVFTNPFYAGFVTGKLVVGKLIKGKHPALIDIKTFLEVQEVLNDNPVAGIPKKTRHDEVPLKAFARDEVSNVQLTGYQSKGIWYYKTKKSDIPVNVSAKHLNELFVQLLTKYEFNPSQKGIIQKKMIDALKGVLSKRTEETSLIKKKISEKKALLEKLEEKFINDQISDEIYQKHASKLKVEIEQISNNLASVEFSGSNLEKVVSNCLSVAQNLSQAWISANYENKQCLQKLVFPEGMVYNKKTGAVLTPRVNSLFASIPLLAGVSDQKRKGDSRTNRLNSSRVPRTGFEPAHP
jgi:site-specific DNA recombinase